jgi:hypothetical protein
VPREDEDNGWWRALVDRVMEEVAPATHELDRDAFFEAAYGHFAEAGVWELFPEVLENTGSAAAAGTSLPSSQISTGDFG